MKVILEAFGDKLRSEPMDFPEDSGAVINLAFDTAWYRQSPAFTGLPGDLNPAVPRIGKFADTGKQQILADGNPVRLYRLVSLGIP